MKKGGDGGGRGVKRRGWRKGMEWRGEVKKSNEEGVVVVLLHGKVLMDSGKKTNKKKLKKTLRKLRNVLPRSLNKEKINCEKNGKNVY